MISKLCGQSNLILIFIKKLILKISENSMENTCTSVSFIKKQWILRNFQEHLYYRTPPDGCFLIFFQDVQLTYWGNSQSQVSTYKYYLKYTAYAKYLQISWILSVKEFHKYCMKVSAGFSKFVEERYLRKLIAN